MRADVSRQTAEVEYDPTKTSPDALAKAITDGTEFEASVQPKGTG